MSATAVQGIDANGNVVPLADVNSLCPSKSTALGTKTTGAAWDNGDELAITAGAVFLHVFCVQDTFLIADTLQTDPTTDPAAYAGGQTHVVPCRGQTYLHFKQVSASGAIYVTAFHN